MKRTTGLCKFCKNQSCWCGDNHYCESGNNYLPFVPVDGYSREEIIKKWFAFDHSIDWGLK